MRFTKRRFESLSLRQQHKQAALLLKEMWNGAIPLDEYTLLAEWLKLPPLKNSPEALSDRFHYHLQKGKISYQEDNFLTSVRTKDRPQSDEPFLDLTIYLDHIRSAHNVGSILRTIEAFRLGKVVFSEQTPTPDHPQVKRRAMGTIPYVPWQIGSIENLPRPIIALETSNLAHSIYDYAFPKAFTLVLGNEEYGCSKEVLKAADAIVEIPLLGMKNSLNVANAFAIAAAFIRKSLNGIESGDVLDSQLPQKIIDPRTNPSPNLTAKL